MTFQSAAGRAFLAARRRTANTGGGAIDMPVSMSTRSSMFIAGSMNAITSAITGGGTDARSSMSSCSNFSVGTTGPQPRHHLGLLDELMCQVRAGEPGEVEVQPMGCMLSTGSATDARFWQRRPR